MTVRNTLLNVGVSWKTSAVGVITGLIAILPELQALIDDDQATVADWNIIVIGLGVIFGLAVARDGDKSSQDVGVRS